MEFARLALSFFSKLLFFLSSFAFFLLVCFFLSLQLGEIFSDLPSIDSLSVRQLPLLQDKEESPRCDSHDKAEHLLLINA
jgi:hypothetical protein